MPHIAFKRHGFLYRTVRLKGSLEKGDHGGLQVTPPAKSPRDPRPLAKNDTLRIYDENRENLLVQGKIELPNKKRPEEVALIVQNGSDYDENARLVLKDLSYYIGSPILIFSADAYKRAPKFKK